jgi:hypothetical protein
VRECGAASGTADARRRRAVNDNRVMLAPPLPIHPPCAGPRPAGRRRAAVLALLAAALLAGCAAPRPPGPPPLTASPRVPPAFPVPSACERMVHLARQEWVLFGAPEVQALPGSAPRLVFAAPGAPTHELHAAMLSRVMVYWYGVSRAPIVGNAGELRPWSAAFLSWLARGAGLGADTFPATVLHWDYIERFIAPRPGDEFETRDPARHAPQVGDLVCNARAGNADDAARAAGFMRFAGLRRGAYHCDLVVAARPGELEAIGGNVSDVVALTRVATGADGRLLPDPRRPWAAVIARRDPAASRACAALPPSPPAASPPPRPADAAS